MYQLEITFFTSQLQNRCFLFIGSTLIKNPLFQKSSANRSSNGTICPRQTTETAKILLFVNGFDAIFAHFLIWQILQNYRLASLILI
ncbi:MAG: hypothetical protein COT74_08150 [Bdellovibrionales bacterium CG10_big_fil_rev_8_21_14_0_10_45_34]|nr:MAG: hypothetical protein COT74_08150 [Bdellovibrionales bacterium CG10_big_fil_rev_8_21_14_0_10_45_34]